MRNRINHISKNDHNLRRIVYSYIEQYPLSTHNSVVLGTNIHALDVLRIIRELKHCGYLREHIQALGNDRDPNNSFFYTIKKAFPDHKHIDV